MAVVETILTSDFAVRVVYPFVLVFVLIFAILQKSKIFGDDKRQIDALIALSIALIFVAFNWATDWIINMMPILAVALVSILVFLLIYGFVASGQDGLEIPNWIKNVAILIATAVVIFSILFASGYWEYVYDSFFSGGEVSGFWVDVIIILFVIGLLVLVVWPFSKKGDKKKSS
jgi:hypothetical protein